MLAMGIKEFRCTHCKRKQTVDTLNGELATCCGELKEVKTQVLELVKHPLIKNQIGKTKAIIHPGGTVEIREYEYIGGNTFAPFDNRFYGEAKLKELHHDSVEDFTESLLRRGFRFV